jgi:hypothetical protein
MQSYEQTPFAHFDNLPAGEGKRCFDVGYENERRIVQLLRDRDWAVLWHNETGDYGRGYDITIQKDGIEASIHGIIEESAKGNTSRAKQKIKELIPEYTPWFA